MTALATGTSETGRVRHAGRWVVIQTQPQLRYHLVAVCSPKVRLFAIAENDRRRAVTCQSCQRWLDTRASA